MTDPVTIIGTPISPYVRKVLVFCELKRIPYRVDPIVAFFADDRFTELSPLRRIPVLLDGEVRIADSSVICQYLEDRYAEPALFPVDPADAARARWLEEYADTRIGDVFIWRLFNEKIIKPGVWKTPREPERVRRIVAEEVPSVMDYLESQIPKEISDGGFLFGALSIAEIAIAAFFPNARWAGFEPEAARWPKTTVLVRRTLALPPFAKLAEIEDQLIWTPVSEQRALLAEAGFPLADEITTGPEPRRGPMTV